MSINSPADPPALGPTRLVPVPMPPLRVETRPSSKLSRFCLDDHVTLIETREGSPREACTEGDDPHGESAKVPQIPCHIPPNTDMVRYLYRYVLDLAYRFVS